MTWIQRKVEWRRCLRGCCAILVLFALGSASADDIVQDPLSSGGTGPRLVHIPGGEAKLGSPASEEGRYPDEGPQRAVPIEGFLLGETEVTVGQFSTFVKRTGYEVEALENGCFLWNGDRLKYEVKIDYRAIPGFDSSDDHPVVCVNSRDALAYVNWLSEQTGESYRLPTEAEWEYAAEADASTSRFWGDDPNQACRYANVNDQNFRRRYVDDERSFHDCDDGFPQAAPVAQFEPNAWGLYDMLGNVWEWTCSENDELSSAQPTVCAEPTSRKYRVFKGGAWYIQPRGVRSSHRNAGFFGGQVVSIGFRVARDL